MGPKFETKKTKASSMEFKRTFLMEELDIFLVEGFIEFHDGFEIQPEKLTLFLVLENLFY